MAKIPFQFKTYRTNKNLNRHLILEDMILYCVANNLLLDTYFTINEIESLRPLKNKRFSTIKYLLAVNDLESKEKNGLVNSIRITKQGTDAYYSEKYKEAGQRQIQRVWHNAINILLSVVVATAAIIALSPKNQSDELKAIEKIEEQIKIQNRILDSRLKFPSPKVVAPDSISDQHP